MKTLMISTLNDHAVEDRVREILKEADIESDLFNIAGQEVRGCVGCGKCYRRRQCMFQDDVNAVINEIEGSDGLLVICGAVYTDVDEAIHRFMKRLFNCASDLFSSKPALCVVVSPSQKHVSHKLDRYFEQGNMPVVTSVSSNCIRDEKDPALDAVMGNYIWLLSCINSAKKSGTVKEPAKAMRTFKFIR